MPNVGYTRGGWIFTDLSDVSPLCGAEIMMHLQVPGSINLLRQQPGCTLWNHILQAEVVRHATLLINVPKISLRTSRTSQLT